MFEMREQGLVEVEDASARFVAEATREPGSVVLCAMEGSRPLLVEVQALVAPTELVPPRRVANGVDRNRLALVIAVLARHAGVSLGSSDVFVSVAGGVRVDEPGADLAVALALASAARGRRWATAGAPGRLRRARPDGRAAPRRPPRPPPRGGEEVRPGHGDRPGRRRPRHPRRPASDAAEASPARRLSAAAEMRLVPSILAQRLQACSSASAPRPPYPAPYAPRRPAARSGSNRTRPLS